MQRVTLVQSGARHNYALGRFLHDHDMLQRIYTDFALGAGDPLKALSALPMPDAIRSKLLRRSTDAVPADMIRNGVDVTLPLLGQRSFRRPSDQDIKQSAGFYLQYFAQGDYIRSRAPGKPIISDVIIVPGAYRIADAEVARFPEWGERPTSPASAQVYETQARKMSEFSDILFCPSRAVIDDIATYGEHYASKCRLVPYGASLKSVTATAPEPGRVLFCGSLSLRKGVQYVRAAAAALESRPHFKFVFAGSATPEARARLTAPNIELLGHLGKEALVRELERADVFLFPSLAEGAAGTVLEAMASGLPIIATRAAGVDFTDGESGIIVPPRDPDAIAAAVLRICEDRPLRDAMAASAARESATYSMAAWEQRFIAAVRDAL